MVSVSLLGLPAFHCCFYSVLSMHSREGPFSDASQIGHFLLKIFSGLCTTARTTVSINLPPVSASLFLLSSNYCFLSHCLCSSHSGFLCTAFLALAFHLIHLPVIFLLCPPVSPLSQYLPGSLPCFLQASAQMLNHTSSEQTFMTSTILILLNLFIFVHSIITSTYVT